MIQAFRPKPPNAFRIKSARRRWRYLVVVVAAVLAPTAGWAQAPLATSYATRDGRAPTLVLGCVSTDGSFTAQPCGVAGYPVHVTVDGGVGTGSTSMPTTAAGAASSQLIGVQGGGAGALPVSVTDAAVAQVVVQAQLAAVALGTPNDAAAVSTGSVVAQLRRIATLLAAAPNGAVNADGGEQVHLMNLPATQPVSASALPLPAGAATSAGQSALSGDGGSQVHVQNFPASQPVTNAGAFAVQDSAVIAGVTSVATNTAVRSGAWTDASFTATSTASAPSALAAITSRIGLHVWNIGSVTACLNYTAAAAASGSGCAAGSVPIAAGSAYLEDQPGNVSPEAISLVCAGSSCPLTIKVR